MLCYAMLCYDCTFLYEFSEKSQSTSLYSSLKALSAVTIKCRQKVLKVKVLFNIALAFHHCVFNNVFVCLSLILNSLHILRKPTNYEKNYALTASYLFYSRAPTYSHSLFLFIGQDETSIRPRHS